MADYFNKIRPVLEALQIGEAVIYPISRMKSVRTQASELGAIHNRQYTTKTDREARTITVKRTCLLYTSPSPRDRTRSRMPSSA